MEPLWFCFPVTSVSFSSGGRKLRNVSLHPLLLWWSAHVEPTLGNNHFTMWLNCASHSNGGPGFLKVSHWRLWGFDFHQVSAAPGRADRTASPPLAQGWCGLGAELNHVLQWLDAVCTCVVVDLEHEMLAQASCSAHQSGLQLYFTCWLTFWCCFALTEFRTLFNEVWGISGLDSTYLSFTHFNTCVNITNKNSSEEIHYC